MAERELVAYNVSDPDDIVAMEIAASIAAGDAQVSMSAAAASYEASLEQQALDASQVFLDSFYESLKERVGGLLSAVTTALDRAATFLTSLFGGSAPTPEAPLDVGGLEQAEELAGDIAGKTSSFTADAQARGIAVLLTSEPSDGDFEFISEAIVEEGAGVAQAILDDLSDISTD